MFQAMKQHTPVGVSYQVDLDSLPDPREWGATPLQEEKDKEEGDTEDGSKEEGGKEYGDKEEGGSEGGKEDGGGTEEEGGALAFIDGSDDLILDAEPGVTVEYDGYDKNLLDLYVCGVCNVRCVLYAVRGAWCVVRGAWCVCVILHTNHTDLSFFLSLFLSLFLSFSGTTKERWARQTTSRGRSVKRTTSRGQ